MRNRNLPVLATLVALALPGAARAETYFGFTIGVSNAPPPPRIVVVHQPHVILVPETHVYAVDDDDFNCDMFHTDRYWYAYDNGFWYRAVNYGGPYRVVDVHYVPRRVLTVGPRYWHHREVRRVEYAEERHDNGRHDHGHGHGHGHDHD